MKTVDEIKNMANRSGYTCVADFLLLGSAWWDDYYTPLLARLPALEHQYRSNAEAETIINLTKKEINLYSKHASEYGYQFFLFKNKQ
jgi:hypothetical protein